jgi:hypothetical protein
MFFKVSTNVLTWVIFGGLIAKLHPVVYHTKSAHVNSNLLAIFEPTRASFVKIVVPISQDILK